VHEENVNIGDWSMLATSCCKSSSVYRTVADKESLVAGGHEVAGLPVGSVTDLVAIVSPCSKPVLACQSNCCWKRICLTGPVR
jgi:hypothetical protein